MCLISLPYYFFRTNTPVQHDFCIFFQCFLVKNRKKSVNFLQFFLSVYQQVTKKLKKKFVKTLDKI